MRRTKLKIRRGTTQQWTQYNPILSDGEIAVERKDDGSNIVKIGDGLRAYTALPGISGEGEGNTTASIIQMDPQNSEDSVIIEQIKLYMSNPCPGESYMIVDNGKTQTVNGTAVKVYDYFYYIEYLNVDTIAYKWSRYPQYVSNLMFSSKTELDTYLSKATLAQSGTMYMCAITSGNTTMYKMYVYCGKNASNDPITKSIDDIIDTTTITNNISTNANNIANIWNSLGYKNIISNTNTLKSIIDDIITNVNAINSILDISNTNGNAIAIINSNINKLNSDIANIKSVVDSLTLAVSATLNKMNDASESILDYMKKIVYGKWDGEKWIDGDVNNV